MEYARESPTPIFHQQVVRLCALALACCLATLSSREVHYAVIALLFAIGGVHGGFDLPLIFQQWRRARALLATLAYGALAVVCFFAYSWAPNFAAAVLLGLSVWHFGLSTNNVSRVASGAAMLSAVLIMDPLALRWLASSWMPPTTVSATVCVASVCAVSMLWARKRMVKSDTLSTLAWTALALCLPALLWVALFFCFEHAWRHYRTLWRVQRLPAKKWPLALALLALLAPLILLASYINLDMQSVQRFLGPLLLALTVPHMVLIDGLDLLNQKSEAKHVV